MPIYEYENDRGERCEAWRPVSRRDCAPRRGYKRVQSRLGVVFQPLADPGSAAVAVPRALRELEQTKSHREIARESGFSTRKLKQVWKI